MGCFLEFRASVRANTRLLEQDMGIQNLGLIIHLVLIFEMLVENFYHLVILRILRVYGRK